jgi:hypothetical protein
MSNVSPFGDNRVELSQVIKSSYEALSANPCHLVSLDTVHMTKLIHKQLIIIYQAATLVAILLLKTLLLTFLYLFMYTSLPSSIDIFLMHYS